MTLPEAQASDREADALVKMGEEFQRRLCNLVGFAHRENCVCQEIPLALANKRFEGGLRLIREIPTFTGSL